MKKIKTIIMTLAFGILLSIGVIAQGPPPPPTDPTASGNQHPNGSSPTGAPIEPETGLLLIMAAVYGLKEVKRVILQEVKS